MHINICKKLFKTLMVLTTLMYCGNGYTTNESTFTLNNFSMNEYLSKNLRPESCYVEDNGLIRYKEDKLIKYDGKTCYDFQILLDKAMGDGDKKINIQGKI